MKYETHPYLLLSQITTKVADAIQSQPTKKDFADVWSGIGFMICGQSMAASLGEVIEIITVPKYTFVPGAKPWVMGIANVRGTLIPIVDLEHFCGQSLAGNRRNHRVLVVNYQGSSVGLVVSKVVGMQHIENESLVDCNNVTDEDFFNYVDKQYTLNGENWYRFSPNKLFDSEEFKNASLLQQMGDGINSNNAAA